MATLVGRPAVLGRDIIQAGTRFTAWNTAPRWPPERLSIASMQCAETVQRKQAESLFHNVVTDLLVCQSLERNAEFDHAPDRTHRPNPSIASMQCAERVQRKQAESLFHNVVTDLLVCQSLEMTIEIRRTSKKTSQFQARRPRRGVRG